MAKSAAGAGRAGGPIGVFLLDDHEVVRRGLRDILMAEPDIEVVGEADQVATALPLILELRPNVAVLDVRLPDGDGISLCREIRSARPETACLMLTSFGDDQAMVSSIIAGASGYVMKTSGSAELIGAIRASASGLSMIDPRAALEVIERLRNQTVTMTSMSALTDQERRVLDLVGEGMTNRQIAERLSLSEKTVKNYVASLLSKLGMHRRSQAAAYIARRGETPKL
ncbi:MAG TPA: response regulator transcription factor [Streptosporangiaceae bacterium]|jgi:two-component system, NarL family, response regulator DevR|nr:response regulator transcription factor [Streptosporangiaceae bacterium]